MYCLMARQHKITYMLTWALLVIYLLYSPLFPRILEVNMSPTGQKLGMAHILLTSTNHSRHLETEYCM